MYERLATIYFMFVLSVMDLSSLYNVKYLLTNRMNQKVLKTFFSIIRDKGGHGDNPDVVQFRGAYRASSVDFMYCKSKSANCSGELDRFFLRLQNVQGLNENVNNNNNLEYDHIAPYLKAMSVILL